MRIPEALTSALGATQIIIPLASALEVSTRANDGKTLVSVDLSEIQHKPLPARSPRDHHADVAPFKARIEALEAELVRLQASSAGHRADFERERERAERLVNDVLRATSETMAAREETARLKGVLAAWRARSLLQRLFG